MRTFLRATISLRFFRLRALNTSLQNNSYHQHNVELSKMADWTVYKPEGSLANFNHPFVFVDIMAERVVQEVFTHYNYAITSVLKCVLAKKRQSRTKPRCPPYAGKMKVTGSQFPGWEEAKKSLPRNQRTYLQNGVLWRHYLHFLRNAWKFSNKISLLEHLCVLSMLLSTRAWRSDQKMTVFWNESCFSWRTLALCSTDHNNP